MNNLRKLFAAISLTIMLAGTTLADCPTPVPGEINSPPCTSTQQLSDSADQTTTAMTISSEAQTVVLDVVIAALENLLTVY
jgi:hypothetical protein